jgi:hypothetical protein
MNINTLSTVGNVAFLSPETLEDYGFPCDIQGVHPFLVLDAVVRDGHTHSLVVPLTTKGSRWTSVRIPDEFLRGTVLFCSRTSWVYSALYARWYPTWALLEAVSPSPDTRHNGNRLTVAGVRFVLNLIVIPHLGPEAA